MVQLRLLHCCRAAQVPAVQHFGAPVGAEAHRFERRRQAGFFKKVEFNRGAVAGDLEVRPRGAPAGASPRDALPH